jgi:peptide chain release factor 1
VSQQSERSQLKNRDVAIKILKSKLHNHYYQLKHNEFAANKKNQVGEGDRSEKIRTYNFPANRLTDHRANIDIFDLKSIIQNGYLDKLIDKISSHKVLDAIISYKIPEIVI